MAIDHPPAHFDDVASSRVRRARLAYELGRARRALLGALPMLTVALLVIVTVPVVWQSYAAALGVVLGSAVALWWGQGLGTAVWPGTLAGLLPLGCAVFAQYSGHACAGGHCYSLCMPLCLLGGGAAGIAIGTSFGRQERHRAQFAAAAIGLAWATGAMGCGCIGGGGAWAILGGLLVGALPVLLLKSRRADGAAV